MSFSAAHFVASGPPLDELVDPLLLDDDEDDELVAPPLLEELEELDSSSSFAPFVDEPVVLPVAGALLQATTASAAARREPTARSERVGVTMRQCPFEAALVAATGHQCSGRTMAAEM